MTKNINFTAKKYKKNSTITKGISTPPPPLPPPRFAERSTMRLYLLLGLLVTFFISCPAEYDISYTSGPNDAEAVAAASNALAIGFASGDSASSVTTNVMLTNMGDDGVNITWGSSDTDVINVDGTVTRLVENVT